MRNVFFKAYAENIFSETFYLSCIVTKTNVPNSYKKYFTSFILHILIRSDTNLVATLAQKKFACSLIQGFIRSILGCQCQLSRQ